MNAVSIIGVVSVSGLVFLWLLALCAEKGMHPLRRVRDGYGRLPVWEKMLLSLFVGAWLVFASEKNDGTNGVSQVEGDTNTVTQIEGGTNDWSNVEGTNVVGQTDRGDTGTNGIDGVGGLLAMGFFGRPNLAQGMGPTITGDDVERMFRVATTFDVNLFAEPTANAVTNAAWLDYGGMSDTFRLVPEGWHFPFGDQTAMGLTVFENGEFRPNVKTHFFPPPFDANLSLLPRMNWGLLPDGGESVFWHEQTPSNSLVLTWHNALYNRDVNCPTNFQAEIFADGRFDYRYPGRTVRYAPVSPFDWDGDGLENSVDTEPLAAGLDAHGTNAEWYNRVCGTVFMATQGAEGVELAPRASDVNTNAYYFVDVVAQSFAPVYFLADGESRLGNPVIVARAGETNHVPLLIGATYCISSAVPVTVFAPDAVTVENRCLETGSCYDIQWPLLFEEVTTVVTDGLIHTFNPDPDWLGGRFNWFVSRSQHAEGPSLMGMPAPDTACGFHFEDNQVGFACSNGSCDCGGCTARGTYVYEGYEFSLPAVLCECSPSVSSGIDTPDPSIASFNIDFDKEVVIFEDAYEEGPEHNVGRRSSLIRITISASGGTHGGSFSFTTSNFGKLECEGGGTLQFERKELAPCETYLRSYVCTGKSASDSENDVELSGTFIEADTGREIQKRDRLSVVRVEISRLDDAPENSRLHRHSYGLGEKMYVHQRPSNPLVGLIVNDARILGTGAARLVTWGVNNVDHQFRMICHGTEFDPLVRVLKPERVVGCAVQSLTNGTMVAGEAGGIALIQRFRVLPLTVSFDALSVEEVPCYETIEPTGYFRTVSEDVFQRSHTKLAHAGVWGRIVDGNYWGYENSYDSAGYLGVLTRKMSDGTPTEDASYGWMGGGTLIWKIPFGWNSRDPAEDAQPLGEFSPGEFQTFRLDANGDFRIEKLGHVAERKIDGTVLLDGNPDDGKKE